MNQKQLDRMIAKHAAWTKNPEKGERMSLANCDLSGLSFRNANLMGAIFYNTALIECDFTETNLSRAVFKRCELSEIRADRADWAGVAIENSRAAGAVFARAYLDRCLILRSDFSCARTTKASIRFGALREVNLRDATLYRTSFDGTHCEACDLSGAEINWVSGDGTRIKSINADLWEIAFTRDTMAIGCKQHPIEDWWKFSDAQISAMDPNALAWWQVWKPILQNIIASAPAA